MDNYSYVHVDDKNYPNTLYFSQNSIAKELTYFQVSILFHTYLII